MLPSADPICPIVDRCGGCPAMGRPLDDQLDAKLELLRRGLGRDPDEVVRSPRTEGYRARISLKVGSDGRPSYQAAGSHAAVPVERCAVARPEINAALREMAQAAPDLRPLQRLELRSDGARVVVCAEAKDAAGARRVLERLPFDSALNGRTLRGDSALTLTVCGVQHRVGPRSFFQVNPEVNELLTAAVRAEVLALSPALVLDLFAGIGNLSFPLAAAQVPVVLWESEQAAVADAKATAKRLGLRAEIRLADVGRFAAGELFFDVALLDPPRAGAPGLIPKLLLTRPRAIVYVSCNPYTLARDLAPALAAGYTLSRLSAFDMFPHTEHVETLAVLKRA